EYRTRNVEFRGNRTARFSPRRIFPLCRHGRSYHPVRPSKFDIPCSWFDIWFFPSRNIECRKHSAVYRLLCYSTVVCVHIGYRIHLSVLRSSTFLVPCSIIHFSFLILSSSLSLCLPRRQLGHQAHTGDHLVELEVGL